MAHRAGSKGTRVSRPLEDADDEDGVMDDGRHGCWLAPLGEKSRTNTSLGRRTVDPRATMTVGGWFGVEGGGGSRGTMWGHIKSINVHVKVTQPVERCD